MLLVWSSKEHHSLIRSPAFFWLQKLKMVTSWKSYSWLRKPMVDVTKGFHLGHTHTLTKMVISLCALFLVLVFLGVLVKHPRAPDFSGLILQRPFYQVCVRGDVCGWRVERTVTIRKGTAGAQCDIFYSFN